jgi:hypothetical protein
MLMRYHWGLGIGHVYSHVGQRANAPVAPTTTQAVDDAFNNTADTLYAVHKVILESQGNTENDELGFDNWEDDWVDEEYSEDGLSQVDDEDNELILAMDSMYGSVEYDNHFY